MTESGSVVAWSGARDQKKGRGYHKEAQSYFWGDGFVHYFNCHDGFMGLIIKLYNLNMCDLLDVNYNSIKWFKKKKRKRTHTHHMI